MPFTLDTLIEAGEAHKAGVKAGSGARSVYDGFCELIRDNARALAAGLTSPIELFAERHGTTLEEARTLIEGMLRAEAAKAVTR